VHLYIENDHFIKTGSGQTQGKLRKEDTTVYDAGTTAMPDEDEAAGTNYYSRYLNATKHGALSAMTFHQYLLRAILVYKPNDLNRDWRTVSLRCGIKTAGFEPKRPEI
jgi:hypothetical protein